jgi:anaerobic selenocysteine-containing dehydrogenase
LIVVDPRRTETAMRADIHLAPKPGHDGAILAGLLRVILQEDLWDRSFVEENVDGIEALREAVAPFEPHMVAERADIPADDLVRAARLFGSARRGYVIAGTGPSMSGRSTLVEYLVRCLDTVTGHHLRAGELVTAPVCFLPFTQPKAQASPPSPAFDEEVRLRVRGLVKSAAGMPTAALPDEILMPGDGRIRALLSLGGNPGVAWPDQLKSVEALRSLDLLVHLDIQMTATAWLADYVLPSTLPYEVPGTNVFADVLPVYNAVWGMTTSFARYSPLQGLRGE